MKIKKIALIGLGYVGLPLAIEFGKKFKVIGYDISEDRINLLKKFDDPNLEISKKEFSESSHLSFSSIIDDIKDCNIFIVTVPTPIDNHKRPDLTALKNECSRVECKNILISRTGSEGAVELFFLDDIGIIGNHTLGYCEFSINQICENKLPDKT